MVNVEYYESHHLLWHEMNNEKKKQAKTKRNKHRPDREKDREKNYEIICLTISSITQNLILKLKEN